MGDTNTLSIQLTVGADGLVSGLKLAGTQVDGAAQKMRTSFHGAAESTEGLTAALKEFKSESVQSGRLAGYYAKELTEIIPASDGAAGALKGLISAGLSGGFMAAGFELTITAAKALKEVFTELATESRKSANEFKAAYSEAFASAAKPLLEVQKQLRTPMTLTDAAWEKQADEAHEKMAELRHEIKEAETPEGWRAFWSGFTGGLVEATDGDKIFELKKKLLATSSGLTDAKPVRDQTAQAERLKQNAEIDLQIETMEAQLGDRLVQIEADKNERIHALLGRAFADTKERAKLQQAIENDAAVQSTRFKEDQRLEENARLITLSDQFATEDIKVQSAAGIKAAQLRLAAHRAAEPMMRQLLLEEAATEESFAKQSADRILRTRLQAINDEYVQTVARRQAIEQESLKKFSEAEDQMAALRAAGGNKQIAQELLRVQQENDARKVGYNEAEEHQRITHEQFLARVKASDAAAAKEITDIWTKEYKKQVEGFIRPLEAAFSGMVKSMIDGTKTPLQALEQFGTSILGSIVDGIVKMGAEWVATKLASVAATAALSTAEVTGAATAAAASKAGNISSTQANIATAMSGAASAMASIPFVGPELAVAAAAAMFGVLEGMTAPLFAASGGFDIPAGINPVVRAHQREMILPEEHADTIRSLSGSGGGGDTHKWTVYAMDAKSFGQWLGMPETRRQMAENLRTGRGG